MTVTKQTMIANSRNRSLLPEKQWSLELRKDSADGETCISAGIYDDRIGNSRRRGFLYVPAEYLRANLPNPLPSIEELKRIISDMIQMDSG